MREQEDAESASSVETNLVQAADGHNTSRVEDFGRKLAHQFPWSPAAYVAVGLALRRRLLADPKAPSQLGKRRQITKVRTYARPTQQLGGCCMLCTWALHGVWGCCRATQGQLLAVSLGCQGNWSFTCSCALLVGPVTMHMVCPRLCGSLLQCHQG